MYEIFVYVSIHKHTYVHTLNESIWFKQISQILENEQTKDHRSTPYLESSRFNYTALSLLRWCFIMRPPCPLKSCS